MYFDFPSHMCFKTLKWYPNDSENYDKHIPISSKATFTWPPNEDWLLAWVAHCLHNPTNWSQVILRENVVLSRHPFVYN